MKQKIEVKIEKLVFGGQAIGKTEDGQVVFVWNALPKETVIAEIIKRKKQYLEAIAVQVLEASPSRTKPLEAHYLSSSPWSIMDQETELAHKVEIAREVFQKNGNITLPNTLDITAGEKDYGYRNKIEFSFTEDESGENSLAFFNRGGKGKMTVEISHLAEPIINETAKNILDWINTTKMTPYNLKSLIVRSNGKGEAIAALFIKDEMTFSDLPKLTKGLLGFKIYYSTHKSPASVPTKLLYSSGDEHLTTELLGTKLKFGLLSFFQVNIPVFESALREVYKDISKDEEIVDMYSGVGSIGIPLAKKVKSCTLVEINEEAVEFANKNIKLNNIENCRAILAPSEKALDEIKQNKTIIVDPPRAGLHKDVTSKLLEITPEKIVYLSCGLDTQGRDIGLLSQKYKISSAKLFNFFPRTPHIESLITLKLK